LQRKNPRKISWTVLFRRMHKKGISEEVAKKRTRRTVKHQRAVVGASWEAIRAKRNQKPEVRAAARAAALRDGKDKKKQEDANKKSTKAKVRFFLLTVTLYEIWIFFVMDIRDSQCFILLYSSYLERHCCFPWSEQVLQAGCQGCQGFHCQHLPLNSCLGIEINLPSNVAGYLFFRFFYMERSGVSLSFFSRMTMLLPSRLVLHTATRAKSDWSETI